MFALGMFCAGLVVGGIIGGLAVSHILLGPSDIQR